MANDATQVQLHRLSELEALIERGQQTFIEVGLALTEIRDSKLYRQDFATFDQYCEKRWGWTRQRAQQLIAASGSVSEMSTIVDTDDEAPADVANEAQARQLAKIKDPKKRKKVWKKANKIAKKIGAAVTAKLVQQAVEEEAEQTTLPETEEESDTVEPLVPDRSKFNTWIDAIMGIRRDLSTSTRWLVKTKESIKADAESWNEKEVLFFIDGFEGLQAQARSAIAICEELATALKEGKQCQICE